MSFSQSLPSLVETSCWHQIQNKYLQILLTLIRRHYLNVLSFQFSTVLAMWYTKNVKFFFSVFQFPNFFLESQL